MLASLNHPNIAAIYGIEQNALVMDVDPRQAAGEEMSPPGQDVFENRIFN